MKIKRFIDFIITQNCTYKCNYCSQSKLETKSKTNANKKTISSFYRLLDNLEKDFEITITGGEAILHPDFFDIIKTIKEKDFKINLISNFSFDIEIYNKIFTILDNSLNRFDLSFHLDEIKDFQKTIEKLEIFLKNKPQSTNCVLLIPIFNINNKKEKDINTLLNIAKKYNINYDFQHIRILNKFSNQTNEEKKYFPEEIKEKTYGKYCLAGCKSIVIYENGEAYRCYSSRFTKSNHIGNINNKNFKLNKSAKVCTSKYCTCSKPKNYGQILNKKNLILANTTNIANKIFLPCYLIKHFNIIKSKLKQYFNLKT